MATETCSVCRATVVIERPLTDEEKEKWMCGDCHYNLMLEDQAHDSFIRIELPKFKAIIGEVEEELITVDDFYSRMAELVEPF